MKRARKAWNGGKPPGPISDHRLASLTADAVTACTAKVSEWVAEDVTDIAAALLELQDRRALRGNGGEDDD